MSLLTTKEIMEIIPHRQPFLLVDTIEELEDNAYFNSISAASLQ